MQAAVIIPAYNAESTIGDIVARAATYVDAVYVVDDGSEDKTAQKASEQGANLITHSTNQGKGQAVRTAFLELRSSDYEWFILMDADGQHSPDDLGKFTDLIREGDCDFINGSRFGNSDGMPRIRLITNVIMSGILSIVSGVKIMDAQCGYKAFRKNLLKEARLTSSHFEIEDELILEAVRLGMKIRHAEVRTIYRSEKSHIKPVRDTFRFIRFVLKRGLKK